MIECAYVVECCSKTIYTQIRQEPDNTEQFDNLK